MEKGGRGGAGRPPRVARVMNLESMMDVEKIDGGLSALTDVLERIAGRSGGRIMHLEDQTEVVCFRPHDLARFAGQIAANERERLAQEFDRQDVTFYGSAIAASLRRANADGKRPA